MGKKISYNAMLHNKHLESFFGQSPAVAGSDERAYTDDERVVSLETRRANVKYLLSDGLWHKTSEVNSKEVGGTEGTRRLRELREQGLNIEKRKEVEGDEFEYRVV